MQSFHETFTHNTTQHVQNTRYEPSGTVMSIKWVSDMFTVLEKHSDAYLSGRAVCRDDVVLFDRSFLTPWIYTRGDRNNLYVLDAMREIQQTFACQLVLCEAAPLVIKRRLQERYEASTPQEKAIRENLGELNDDYIAHIDRMYAKLKDDSWFDIVLRTDSDDVAATAKALIRTVDQSRQPPAARRAFKPLDDFVPTRRRSNLDSSQ
jgi:hypothetical protein